MKKTYLILLLQLATCHFFGQIEQNQHANQYSPATVLAFIDFQSPTQQVYLLGEDHTRSATYGNELRKKAHSASIFYFTETPLDDEEENIWGIDSPHLFALTRFIQYHYFLYAFKNALNDSDRWFVSYFPFNLIYQTEFENEFYEYAGFIPSNEFYRELEQLWSIYYAKLRFDPNFKDHITNQSDNYFYELCRDNVTQSPDFNGLLYLTQLHSSVLEAALFCLKTVKSILPKLLSQNDYTTINNWFTDVSATHFTDFEIDKLNRTYANIAELVMTQMRNNFFVLKFLEIYEQIKNENRPIILRIGQAHLTGVSELLKSQGISHTCVDLEKMTSTKVTIETEKEFHNHDEL